MFVLTGASERSRSTHYELLRSWNFEILVGSKPCTQQRQLHKKNIQIKIIIKFVIMHGKKGAYNAA